VICAKTAEPVEMLFWMWTRVGPRNHEFGDAQIPQGKPGRANLRNISWSIVDCREYPLCSRYFQPHAAVMQPFAVSTIAACISNYCCCRIEQVKNAERVRLEQIPLPDAPSTQAGEWTHTLTYCHSSFIL